MPTTVTYESTLAGAAALQEVVARRTGLHRREWVPPAVLAAFCLFVAWSAARAESGLDVVVGWAVAAPLSALVVYRVRAAMRRRALARVAGAAGILGRRTVTLGDSGIVATTAFGESLIRWDAVEVLRDESHLLLLGGPAYGLAIPVSAFGPAGVDAFVAEVERRRAPARPR